MYAKIVCLLFLAVVSAQNESPITPPIPLVTEDPGIRFNPLAVGAPVKLEAFIELNCPDSIYTWPILKQLQEEYGPDKLDVVIQHVPLPYHRQAFLCTQGFNIIRDLDPENAITYIDHIFANNARFGNVLTRNMNELDVIDMIANLQAEVTNVNAEDFAANMTANRGYGDTVRAWKFGVRRNVAGTPWFWINNIDLAVNPSIRLTFGDWKEILDPLVEDDMKVEKDEDAVKTGSSGITIMKPIANSENAAGSSAHSINKIMKVDSNINIYKKN